MVGTPPVPSTLPGDAYRSDSWNRVIVHDMDGILSHLSVHSFHNGCNDNCQSQDLCRRDRSHTRHSDTRHVQAGHHRSCIHRKSNGQTFGGRYDMSLPQVGQCHRSARTPQAQLHDGQFHAFRVRRDIDGRRSSCRNKPP